MKIRGKMIGSGRPLLVVPISAKSESEIVSKMIALESEGCEAIEWRVDHFEGADDIDRIRNVMRQAALFLKHTIVIFTYRTQQEGGLGLADPKMYQQLLLDAADLQSIDLIDVEMDYVSCPEEFVRALHCKGKHVILSHHNFHETPSEEEMSRILEDMIDNGADIAKIAVMPHCRQDAFRLMSAAAQVKDLHPEANLLTIAMGKFGAISRLAGESVGSCMTFVTKGASSAPGQMSYEQVALALDHIHTCFRELRADQKLFLIGYMGSGKTTIARTLSARNGIAWVDMDDEIIKTAGKSISDIFAQDGEEAFRSLETSLLKELSEKSGTMIISCGGGVILKDENIAIMKQHGEVIHLSADPETIYHRVKHSTNRPLLKGNMNIDYITQMMEERRERYEKARTAQIITDGKSAESVASEIELCFLR